MCLLIKVEADKSEPSGRSAPEEVTGRPRQVAQAPVPRAELSGTRGCAGEPRTSASAGAALQTPLAHSTGNKAGGGVSGLTGFVRLFQTKKMVKSQNKSYRYLKHFNKEVLEPGSLARLVNTGNRYKDKESNVQTHASKV